MKILITGAKGQLGNKLIEILGQKHELVLTDSDTMDITNATQTMKKISQEKPDFIIHAAAYTKVDQAEEEKDLCYKINALGTKNVSEAANKNEAILIYISTDFVFSGENSEKPISGDEKKTPYSLHPTPYLESDSPSPVSVYGQTKLDGENFVKKICKKYYIIRAAWLFGELPKDHPGSNFVETMLRLAKERDSLSVVNDQVGSPTYTGDLVRFVEFLITSRALRPTSYGLYNFSGEGETTWYGFAKEIFKQTKTKIDLKPITSDQYPSKAKRPTYSYLSKEKAKFLGFKVRTWQEMLTEYLLNRT